MDKLGSKSSSTALVNIHPAENPKTQITTPHFLVYLSDGSSRQFPYDQGATFSISGTELIVETANELESIDLGLVSYFKAIKGVGAE